MRRRPARGFGRWAAAVWCAASLSLALVASPANAQRQAEVALTVTALSGVLGPGTIDPAADPTTAVEPPTTLELRAVVEAEGTLPVTGAQLVVEVHPASLTRGVLAAALDGDLTTTPIAVRSEPLRPVGGVPAGGQVGVSVALAREQIPWAGDAGGVHPVRIAVVRGTEVLAESVTAVVWLNQPPETPVLTNVVWPIDTAPWRGVGGTYQASLEPRTQPGARLDRLVRAAERAPASVPLILAPAAHLLEDLSDRSDGYIAEVRTPGGTVEARTVAPGDPGAVDATSLLRRIRDVAAGQQPAPISGSYAAADLAALVPGGEVEREIAAVAASEGRRRLQMLLATEVDGATHLLTDGVVPEVLDVLPGETLVLPAAVTDLPALGADPDLGQPVRTLRAPSGRFLTALVADPYLTAAFDQVDATAPVLAAQRVVAESAQAYLTAPRSDPRGLILLPPRDWDPPAATAEDILTALSEARWLRFVSPTQLAAQAQRDPRTLGFRPVGPGSLDPTLTAELTSTWRDLEAVVGAIPEGTTQLGGRSIDTLRDDLLRATSYWYRDARQPLALVQGVRRTIEETFGEVEIIASSVTLTADTGQLPISLQRRAGETLLVTVTIESQGRLLWPEGRTSEVLTLEPGTSQTISFATQAVTTGTFPVTVVVTDPAGSRELARGSLSVRSTSISGPALLGIGILVVVLLLAGALRQPPRPPLELVRDTAQDEGEGGAGG
ncbi:MAG: hypothetical protein ACLFS9_05400 [Nitriliruptoraceae bacterium]